MSLRTDAARLQPRRAREPLTVLLGSWLLISAGNWAFSVALAVYAYDRSGSFGAAAATAARLGPAALATPLAGWLLDHADRARIVAHGCLAQAVCLSATAALAGSGLPLAPVLTLAGIGSIALTVARPGLQSLIPAVAVTPAAASRATAAWGAFENLGFLIGGGLGGAAIAILGAPVIAAAAAAAVTLGAGCAWRLPAIRATAIDEHQEYRQLAPLLSGLRALTGTPALRAAFALFAGLLVLDGATGVQLVALAIGRLRMGSGGPGLLFVAWGLGGLLSSLAIVRLARQRGYGLALTVGGLVFAGGLAVCGLDGVALAVAAMIPVGVGFGLVETAIVALVPRLADDAVIGRVYALCELLYAGAAALGALLAAPLVDALGAPGSLSAVGGGFALLTLLGVRSFAELDRGERQATLVRELLHGLAFLAALPLPRLERLVRQARPVNVPAGATVIRRGDPGEEFFVIETGTVEIEQDGRRQGPGYGFGEIALLRDRPRAATVRAVTDLRLWSLSRPALIAAIRAHPEAGRLAQATIDRYLAAGPRG